MKLQKKPVSPTSPRFAPRLKFVPSSPGVYLMRDIRGTVIYVGKAKNLRRRLGSYFSSAHKGRKVEAMLRSVEDFEVQTTRDEASALLMEERLIMDFLPRYNIAQRHGVPRHWIFLEEGPLPRLRVSASKPRPPAKCYGPYHSSAVCHWLVLFLRRLYGLRSCVPEVPGGGDFLHCMEHRLNGCSAPCSGKISPEEYRSRAASAVEWLGQPAWRMSALLRDHMRSLAKARQYEKAALCRDVISSFSSPFSRPAARPRGVTPELALHQLTALQAVLQMENPPALMEAFDISHMGGKGNVSSMVSFVNGRPVRKNYRYFRIQEDGPNDTECMRQAVLRRYSRAALPNLILVDGGLPQLSAAKAALESLGKSPACLIALAKSDETIFRQDGTPLRLEKSSPALHMVQRLRDEAHRFANSYTRRLTAKSMGKNRLEAAGVGRGTARILLTRFGSFAGVEKATPEELSEAGGMGIGLARRLKSRLSVP